MKTVILTHGDYSDYTIDSVFLVPPDLDITAALQAWRSGLSAADEALLEGFEQGGLLSWRDQAAYKRFVALRNERLAYFRALPGVVPASALELHDERGLSAIPPQ